MGQVTLVLRFQPRAQNHKYSLPEPTELALLKRVLDASARALASISRAWLQKGGGVFFAWTIRSARPDLKLVLSA